MPIEPNIFAFRTRFPEFKDVGEGQIAIFFEFAKTQVDEKIWTDDYALGILYLTAHHVSKYLVAQANAADGSGATDLFVSSISFGERSVAFGKRGESDTRLGALGVGERGLDDSLYGQMFLSLRSRNVMSIAIC